MNDLYYNLNQIHAPNFHTHTVFHTFILNTQIYTTLPYKLVKIFNEINNTD